MFVLAGIVAPVSAMPMSVSEAGPPAKLPPAGFAGDVFIDSRGCYYFRTGSNHNLGAIIWVPRVTRTGDVICGLQPTFPGAKVLDQSPADKPQ